MEEARVDDEAKASTQRKKALRIYFKKHSIYPLYEVAVVAVVVAVVVVAVVVTVVFVGDNDDNGDYTNDQYGDASEDSDGHLILGSSGRSGDRAATKPL